ncbi:P27 family phage terminase small subunit [Shewanella frigidimarina]|uniref:P27 family phage terminase small subunit n=1 Tax=Shewanella frigidimarina TaxID=56812 RepID=UPI003D7A7F8B
MAKQPSVAKVTGLGKPPKLMGLDPIIHDFYNEILQAAKLSNTATPSDKIAAMLAAEQFFIYTHAQDALFNPETGAPEIVMTVMGDKGQWLRKPNPALAVMDTAHKRITDLLKEFGLTPRSRKAVEAFEENSESEILKFLKGGND